MCKAVKKEELLSVAQEIAFAKALASNDKSLRDRALKKLKRWLSIRSSQDSSGFTEEGFMRIWKGLFYCVWMADRALVQEECVEYISNLIHCFTELEDIQKFIRCFFQSISQAWFGLDSHRLDKYLMLVRRFLRQMFEYLYQEKWEIEKVEAIRKDLYKSLVLAPIGLNLHLSEIYLEELAKVGRGELKPSTVLELIKPFADFMQISNDPRIMKSLTNSLFLHLLRQSDEGIKHQAKFEVWRQMGFPEGDINVIQEASDDELPPDDTENYRTEADGESEDHLDPRAGKVDVFLPPLDFDAESIRQYLVQVTRRKNCTTKARRTINLIAKKYEVFAQGKYPLGIHKMELPEPEDEEEIIEKTAENLLAEERAAYMEGKRIKKGWKISPIQDQDIIKENEIPSCAGNWEVNSISLKRKVQCDNLVATMKRIKVTLDDSLSISSDAENMETMPSNTETENSGWHKSQIATKIRKRGKNGNVKSPSRNKIINLNENNSNKNELNLNSSLVLEQENQEKPKLNENDEWSSEQTEWDMIEENEVDLAVMPTSPVKSKLNNSFSAKKKLTPGAKTPPAKNVANNTMLNSAKKVSFHLSRNTAQEEKEYKRSLKISPNIPFDAERKPRQSVLKSSTISSPKNPFADLNYLN